MIVPIDEMACTSRCVSNCRLHNGSSVESSYDLPAGSAGLNSAMIAANTLFLRSPAGVCGLDNGNLYQNLRLYMNFSQPSFRLLSNHRERSEVKNSYA